MKKILRPHALLLLALVLCAAFAFPASASAKVKLSRTKVTVAAGKSTTLKLTGTKEKAKWSTNKKKVATVNQKGKVTAKGPGTCRITAKVGSKKYTCKVTVQQVTLRVMSSGSPVDTNQTLSLKKGTSLTLSVQQGTRASKKAEYLYVNAKKKKVTWKSSAPGVIAVNKSGKITAKKAGTATITAKYNGQKIVFTVRGTKEETSVPFLEPAEKGIILRYHIKDSTKKVEEYECPYVGYKTYDENSQIQYEPEERKGYVFAGWYTAEDDGAKIEKGTRVDHSMDLYAYWTPQVASLSFYYDTDSLFRDLDSVEKVQVYLDRPIKDAIGILIASGWDIPKAEDREGYDFKRWCLVDSKSCDFDNHEYYACACGLKFDNVSQASNHLSTCESRVNGPHNYAGPYNEYIYTWGADENVTVTKEKTLKDMIDEEVLNSYDGALIDLVALAEYVPKKFEVIYDGEGLFDQLTSPLDDLKNHSTVTVTYEYGERFGSHGTMPVSMTGVPILLGWSTVKDDPDGSHVVRAYNVVRRAWHLYPYLGNAEPFGLRLKYKDEYVTDGELWLTEADLADLAATLVPEPIPAVLKNPQYGSWKSSDQDVLQVSSADDYKQTTFTYQSDGDTVLSITVKGVRTYTASVTVHLTK